MVGAAVSETVTRGELSAEQGLSAALTPEVRHGQGLVFLPNSYPKLRSRAEWQSGVLPGIEKELRGLKDKRVWDEVECPPGAVPVPCFQIHCQKANGTFETRLVALGNQTLELIHYTECAASMATFAASFGNKLY